MKITDILKLKKSNKNIPTLKTQKWNLEQKNNIKSGVCVECGKNEVEKTSFICAECESSFSSQAIEEELHSLRQQILNK